MTRPADPSGLSVLVTGGAGYIGSHTAEVLRGRGHRPIVLDNLERGHREAVPDVPLVIGDVGDRQLVEEVLREHGASAVIHFAALKSVEESQQDPLRYFRANVMGTLQLLEAMAATGTTLLVYSSSCAVYGTPAVLPVDESAPLRPDNPYGETKAAVERILDWMSGRSPIRSVRLRYFNAAGAALDGSNGEDPRGAANLIPIVLSAALGRRGPVTINGIDYETPDGTAIRDYVHVLDLAEAHALAIDHLARGGGPEVMNLGTGRGASVREIVDIAERASGRRIETVAGPRRPGDPPAVVADPSRAAAVLGWRSRFDLDDIITSAWRWQERHPDGFAD